MKRRFLLNVVVAQSTSIFQLLSGKNQSLLIWWNTLFVLNLGLDIVNRIRRLDIEGNCLPGQSFYKDLEKNKSEMTTTVLVMAGGEHKCNVKIQFTDKPTGCTTTDSCFHGDDGNFTVRWGRPDHNEETALTPMSYNNGEAETSSHVATIRPTCISKSHSWGYNGVRKTKEDYGSNDRGKDF
jgi:hypothetical protein